jgi:hypothetical protein
MRILGIALVALGIVALLYGGITYNKQRTVLEVGDLKVQATEKKSVPIPAVAGVCSIIAGVALMMVPGRRG